MEGRSALLLGKAKDNNASCAVGPFVRLFDAGYTMDDVRVSDIALTVEGVDDFVLEGSSSISQISRDPEELIAATISDNHQYPDGLLLMLGTMFAPIQDRDVEGEGFTHKAGDVVTIANDRLGALVNTVHHCSDCAPWAFGAADLMRNLAGRGCCCQRPDHREYCGRGQGGCLLKHREYGGRCYEARSRYAWKAGGREIGSARGRDVKRKNNVNETVNNQPAVDGDEILDGVLRWVDVESPSHDSDAVNHMADHVEEGLAMIGMKVERTPGRDGYGDILKARTPWGEGPGILVLSHIDTVHALGTKDAANPIRREGDKVYGPGIYDMKAGRLYRLLRHTPHHPPGQRDTVAVDLYVHPEEK